MFENEIDLFEYSNEIESKKLESLIAFTESAYELNIMQSDFKVANENGTYDDLMSLYEAADKDVSKKRETIFKKAMNMIAEAFRKVSNFIRDKWNALAEKLRGKKEPEKVLVDENALKAAKEASKLKTTIKRLFDAIKQNKWKVVAATVATLAAAIIAIAAMFKKAKPSTFFPPAIYPSSPVAPAGGPPSGGVAAKMEKNSTVVSYKDLRNLNDDIKKIADECIYNAEVLAKDGKTIVRYTDASITGGSYTVNGQEYTVSSLLAQAQRTMSDFSSCLLTGLSKLLPAFK